MYKVVDSCRVCSSKKLSRYLDLGRMPLANSIIRPEAKGKKEDFFPLEVLFCNNCSLSQLSIVVQPKLLFWGYVYRSSISKTFQAHCREMAKELKKRLGGRLGLLVLDIASNDGCLLREFKAEGFRVVGVEPATNLAEIAMASGIPTIGEFWSQLAAEKIVKSFGKADIVTATNVLGHVDDVHAFVSAIRAVLKDDGLVVIEVPTVANIVEKNQFDTIYHEHLSYFSVKALKELFEKNNFRVVDAQELEIHGGTKRVFAAKKEGGVKQNNKAVRELLEEEQNKKLYDIETYYNLRKNVEKIKSDLLSLLKEIKMKKQHVAAYGAAAKGSTLLNYCGVGTNYVDFVVDDTPEKQYCWTPGNHLPVFPTSYLEEKKPEYLILLPWNFARELIAKTTLHQKRGGKYIIPIPEVKIVASAEGFK